MCTSKEKVFLHIERGRRIDMKLLWLRDDLSRFSDEYIVLQLIEKLGNSAQLQPRYHSEVK